MKYKIDQLSKISNVSIRALRYYDQIGLLTPSRDKQSNYRYYSTSDVNKLQQILILKTMNVKLKDIKRIIEKSSGNQDDYLKFLTTHQKLLIEQRIQLDTIIETVKQTITNLKGEKNMKDQDKFKGFKEELIKKNDQLYKEEVISKYGNKAYQDSRAHFKNLSDQEFEKFINLNDEILNNLLLIKNNPNDHQLAKHTALLHKEWITLAWGSYDTKRHLSVADMYVEDERFKAYYDSKSDGLAQILRDIIHKYLG